MRTIIILFAILFSLSGAGQVHVNGYYRSNGTYVAPYTRSSPNSSPYDNYSFPGNTNPYTGKTATGNPNTYIKNLYNNKYTSSSSVIWVDGYYQTDGTWINGYYRSAPNGNPYDNFSSPNNTNSYKEKAENGIPETYSKNFNNNSSYDYGTTFYVSSNTLNVRSGPSTNYLVLTTLNYGDNVQVLESLNNNWNKVRVGSTIGYVYSSYLSFSNPSYSTSNYFYTPSTSSNNFSTYTSQSYYTSIQYVNTSTLNVRSGASTNYSVLSTLSYGEPVEVIEEVNSYWTKIKVLYSESCSHKSSYGYVYSNYISATNPLFYNYSNTSSNYLPNILKCNSLPKSFNISYDSSNDPLSSRNHHYGNNKGKLTIWTDCSDCGQISVYIDGDYKGLITKYFQSNTAPDCEDTSAFSLTLTAGTYKISATGNEYEWEEYFKVDVDKCLIKKLAK